MESPTTTNETVAPTLPSHAARYGAIMGGISVVITLLLYAVDYTMMAKWWVGLLMFAISIGVVIYGGINYRNQTTGYISYGKAYQHGYLTFLIGGLIGSIFSILLYTVIDPELPEKLTDAVIENTEEMMRGFGAPEDQIETQLDKMREDMPNTFSAMGVIKQFGIGLIIYAVLTAITSLFVKKNEPEMM